MCCDVPAPCSRTGLLKSAAGSRRTADPQRGKHGISQRVGVEQRKIDLVNILGPQFLMYRIDLRAPQRVGMSPQHRLGPRCGARRILHTARRIRIGGASWAVGAAGEQGFERFRFRRFVSLRGGARIVRNYGQPAQVAAIARDQFGIGGLGDGCDRAAMAAKYSISAERSGCWW